jgi:hypothetical protein
MGGHQARDYWEDAGLLMVMGGILLPMAAWVLDLQISYAMVKWACRVDRGWTLLLVPLLSLSMVGAGASLSWRAWTRLHDAQPAGASMIDRSYLLAVLGLGLNLVSALLILFSFAPRALLSPCE